MRCKMRLASCTPRGRTTFGVVEGEGVIDLRLRFGVRYTTLLDLLRAGALHEVKPAITGVRADFPLAEVELLPPILAPEKILCIGINYNRDSEYKGQNLKETGYPSMFYRHTGSLAGQNHPIVLPKESEPPAHGGRTAL